MKYIISFMALCLAFTTSYAQLGDKRHKAKERIHAAKMAFITDRLHLTAAQSGAFIPLYNDYENALKDTRKSYLSKYKDLNPDSIDDRTAKQYLDDNLDYQQAALDIKRKYKDKFLKILSPQQLTDLMDAEREFKEMLKQRLEERRMPPPKRRW